MLARKPRGYVGHGHETLGVDIVAVLQILKTPETVLGPDEARKLAAVTPDGWYPIAWMIDLMDTLEERMGHYGLVRLGRTVFKLSHEEQAKQRIKSGRHLVDMMDVMYKHNNRGRDIGGWRTLAFEPGYAELEKNTPHHCVMEQGILSAAFGAIGCPVAVAQKQCFRKGAESCIYTITSSVTGPAWG